MALYISNDEADRLARELAAATGESLTDAVTNALRERLERHRRPTDEERIERAMQIARETAALLNGRSIDSKALFDDLYDEFGLPR